MTQQISKEEKRNITNLANFAELLLSQETLKPPVEHNTALNESNFGPESKLDISKVQVPDDFISLVIEGKTAKPAPELKVETKKASPNPTELISKFMNLIQEGKKLIQEMTTCGMIGTNTVAKPIAPKKKKKKSVQEIVNSILNKK